MLIDSINSPGDLLKLLAVLYFNSSNYGCVRGAQATLSPAGTKKSQGVARIVEDPKSKT